VPASHCIAGSTCSSLSSSSSSSVAPAATTPTTPVEGSSSGAAAGASAPRSYGRTVSAGSATAGNDSELDSNEGSSGDSSDTSAASFSGMMEEVLRDAFIKTDEEFSDSGLQAGLVGSTAVVALVGTHRVWIANCGKCQVLVPGCVQWCVELARSAVLPQPHCCSGVVCYGGACIFTGSLGYCCTVPACMHACMVGLSKCGHMSDSASC
jgi:hypothetical protein